MKKYTLPILVATGVLLVAGLIMFAPKANDYTADRQAKSQGAAPAAAPSATNTTPSTAPAVAGKYVDYSDSTIASTTGTKILFFHAPWCPQCKALDASIKAGPIPENTTIIKVDYDSSQALKQKYGVTTQTTLVLVDDNGNLVKKYVAYSTPSLDALIANLL